MFQSVQNVVPSVSHVQLLLIIVAYVLIQQGKVHLLVHAFPTITKLVKEVVTNVVTNVWNALVIKSHVLHVQPI